MTVKLYLAYAKQDKALIEELEKHLGVMKRKGLIEITKDSQIDPGAPYREAQEALLASADIIVFGVSPDFNSDDWHWDRQIMPGMQRHQTGSAIVIPVLLRIVQDWQEQPYGRLQAIPQNGKAVTKWDDRDEAFGSVAERLRDVIDQIMRGKSS